MALELISSTSQNEYITQSHGADNSISAYVLEGHTGGVLSVDFTSTGEYLATAGFDRIILLWNISEGLSNFATLRGHNNAVLQIKWCPSDGTKLISASADKSLGWWDAVQGERIKKLKGHTSIVNSCSMSKFGSPLAVSGADDGTVKIWDMRDRVCSGTFEHSYQILSVDSSDNGDRVFAGTIDDSILVLDCRKLDSPLETLENVGDSVTGVAISNDGDYLLSLGMDGTANLWDIRPFCEERLLYTYSRITNNYEMNLLRIRWSPDDLLFSVGSSDQGLNVHKVRPGMDDMDSQLVSIPEVHEGCVNEVVFHPKERYTVVSASSDKKLVYSPLVIV